MDADLYHDLTHVKRRDILKQSTAGEFRSSEYGAHLIQASVVDPILRSDRSFYEGHSNLEQESSTATIGQWQCNGNGDITSPLFS